MRVAFLNTLIYTKVACKPESIDFARINAEPEVTVKQEINIEPDVIVTPDTPGDVLSLKLDRLIKVVTADVTKKKSFLTKAHQFPYLILFILLINFFNFFKSFIDFFFFVPNRIKKDSP